MANWVGAGTGAAQGAAAGAAFGPWGAVIGGVIGGVGGLLGGDSAKEAKRLARMQAEAEFRAHMENRRQTLREQAYAIGATKAGVAASNLVMGGSSQRHLRAQQSEFRRQLNYADLKARMNYEATIAGGQSIADQIRGDQIAGGIGAIGSLAGSLGPGIAEGLSTGWEKMKHTRSNTMSTGSSNPFLSDSPF
jgi:gas vesicle protein